MSDTDPALAEIERIARLRALLFKFEGYVRNESGRLAGVLADLLSERRSESQCCDKAEVEWLAPHDGMMWIEWECEDHVAGEGIRVPVEDVADRLRS